jgi:hypothetical protein
MWMAELVQDLSFSGSTLCRSGITTAADHLTPMSGIQKYQGHQGP